MAPEVSVPSRTSRSSGFRLLPHLDGLAAGAGAQSQEVCVWACEGQHVAEDSELFRLRRAAAARCVALLLVPSKLPDCATTELLHASLVPEAWFISRCTPNSCSLPKAYTGASSRSCRYWDCPCAA